MRAVRLVKGKLGRIAWAMPLLMAIVVATFVHASARPINATNPLPIYDPQLLSFGPWAFMDADDPAEIAKVEAFVARLNLRALGMDGTCTGEHGIGQGKAGFMRREHGHGVEVMRTIKQALDPQNILNPGKILPA